MGRVKTLVLDVRVATTSLDVCADKFGAASAGHVKSVIDALNQRVEQQGFMHHVSYGDLSDI